MGPARRRAGVASERARRARRRRRQVGGASTRSHAPLQLPPAGPRRRTSCRASKPRSTQENEQLRIQAENKAQAVADEPEQRVTIAAAAEPAVELEHRARTEPLRGLSTVDRASSMVQHRARTEPTRWFSTVHAPSHRQSAQSLQN
jgi:hypothetical protein